jgi:hypothetical protein
MPSYRIETNFAVLNRRVRVFDDAGSLVMSIEQRKRYSPEQVVIEGPAGPMVRVVSRTVQRDEPQYELFAADTGASLGYLRRNGDVLSRGYDTIGRADDTGIVIDTERVATVDAGRVDLLTSRHDPRLVLAIAILRAVPELWLPANDDL